ncbi:hypothetical protein MYCODSM44623_04375 [Mycobacterium intracellulare subsp. chimaera]|uniref:hypothetical protein n=1 Tax=Mycobacterium intracellulare TaxID=1767 RepID=UPI000A66F45A|nr:hypothetical protein [Mycobacterium intracellulare]ASL11067.1 hypothetical protein MYCODSM44623_04375 [Mycobacterium intracellulare subsp. chimaera]MCV7324550.1 hypothetical protein [Mycobacterium intracellulare subsp. chimaera]
MSAKKSHMPSSRDDDDQKPDRAAVRAARLCGILAAASVLLAACASGAADTAQPAESRSGSSASEWFGRILRNLTSPPAPPSVDPLSAIACVDQGGSE